MSSLLQVQLPCKVCLDPSSGVHYGVLSCDACKGFFGRQLKYRGKRKSCVYGGRCNIKGSRKHVCAPCRLRKCLSVGMSKKAIKTGRYTLQWRQSLQTEIQQFEITKAKQQQIVSSHSDELQARLQPDCRLGPNGETIEQVIDTILDAYSLVPSNLRSSQADLDMAAEKYWTEYSLKEKLFGKMPAVSVEEFTEIFSVTGIDVDDRFQFSETYLNSVKRWMSQLVRFIKKVPGFKQLSMEDQFNLLKYNRFEFWFAGVYKGYNPDFSIAVNPNGFCYHKDEMRKTLPTGAHEIIFEVARNLRRKNLTTEEHIIAQTMMLFFSDRAPLKNRAAVENLQAILLTCLEYLVNKRPSAPERVRSLSQAIDMLTTIRELHTVEDIKVTKEGWLDNLNNLKIKFLEQEMNNVENDHMNVQ